MKLAKSIIKITLKSLLNFEEINELDKSDESLEIDIKSQIFKILYSKDRNYLSYYLKRFNFLSNKENSLNYLSEAEINSIAIITLRFMESYFFKSQEKKKFASLFKGRHLVKKRLKLEIYKNLYLG